MAFTFKGTKSEKKSQPYYAKGKSTQAAPLECISKYSAFVQIIARKHFTLLSAAEDPTGCKSLPSPQSPHLEKGTLRKTQNNAKEP